MAKQTNTTDIVAVKEYLIKLFDGEFSPSQIRERRNMVYALIASYTSPKTGKQVGEVLSSDDIGYIINRLESLQFCRRMEAKAKRLGGEF